MRRALLAVVAACGHPVQPHPGPSATIHGSITIAPTIAAAHLAH